jgi:tetratricopeptide (TPR) repeat protein
MTERSPKLLNYFDKGMRAMSSQDFEGAAAWFASLVEIDPTDKEALNLYEKARILNAQKGLNFFKRLGFSILANLLYGFGMKKMAVHYLGILSMDKPHNPNLAAQYGSALMASGQTALASLAFRRALQFLTSNKAILKAAGKAFEEIDDRPAAIDVYLKLSHMEPLVGEWSLRVKNLSATHYGETGGIKDLQSKRAEEDRKAIQQQSLEGKEERIRELLAEYQANPEGKKNVLSEIGRLLVEIEKYDQALAIWTRVIEGLKTGVDGNEKTELEDRQIEEALFQIASCHEKRERFDKAEEGYQNLVSKFPNDPRYCDALYAIKLKVINRDIEEHPDDTTLVAERQRVEKEHLGAKAKLLHDLVERRPGDPDILLTYGKVLAEKGDIDEAIPVFQKVSMNPARIYPALHQLGWLFIEKGQIPLAIDTFKRALEKAPPARVPTNDIKDIWYGLGESYFRQGDSTNAREWWKNIYECDIEFRDVRQRYEGLVK